MRDDGGEHWDEGKVVGEEKLGLGCGEGRGRYGRALYVTLQGGGHLSLQVFFFLNSFSPYCLSVLRVAVRLHY